LTIGIIAAMTGCDRGPTGAEAPGSEPATPAVALGAVVSRLDARPGERVGVGLALRPAGALAAAQVVLRFDPAALRFEGQLATGTFLILNPALAAQGRLVALALEADGLPEVVGGLVFRAVAPGYGAAITLEPVELVTTGVAVERRPVTSVPVTLAPQLPEDPADGALTLADWATRFGEGADGSAGARTPGQYVENLRYGDATLNGAITGLDAATVANVAVGNVQLLTGTESPSRDFVVAGNVRPANPPGLGEVGDLVGPGVEADGSRRLTGLDAAAIANEVVLNEQDVVGELIPGREPPPTDRVIVQGDLAGIRTFTRDTIYQLRGMVRIPSGAALVIEPGTRIEGDPATRGTLVVSAGGLLVAAGTFLQPVVFTCAGPAPTPGCWGGVVMLGYALLNNGEGTGGNIGCPVRQAPGGAGPYGGCLNQHGSGTLRYVRIEFAGQAPPGEGPVAGLSLLGAGGGTNVDSVQVYRSAGDGVFVSGGHVRPRTLVLTDNAGAGLRWDDGWEGQGQFIIIQQEPTAGPALVGSNAISDHDAGPRSHPELYHVTIAGSGGGIRLERGTDLVLRDAVILGPAGAGFDVNDAATCARLGLGIQLDASIFFQGSPDFATDADCADEPAFALDPARGNRVLDPQLIAPEATVVRDFRPRSGSPALTGFVLPAPNGFFDLSALHIGGVGGTSLAANYVPCYSGWIRVP
jgi:hypothetical protein